MKKELHWYFLVQYIDQKGFESRKEMIRLSRSHYRTDKGCWKAALEEIFEKEEDYEDISNITLVARGWEEREEYILL